MNLKLRYLVFIAILLIIVTITSISFLLHKRKDYVDFDLKIPNDRKIVALERIIAEYRRRLSSDEKPRTDRDLYRKRPETQHIDCGRALKGDKEYIKTITGVNRIPLIEDPTLDMSCEAVKERIVPSREWKHGTGVAFARIVYRDYELVEKQVQMSFHPQNVFCFAVDRKAPEEFHRRMKALGECLENVIVLPATENYDSNGHNTNLGHYRCMEAMLHSPSWNYFVVQENHDIVTKSVYELMKIFEIFGGANDVGINPLIEGRTREWFKLDPKSLKLFRNESAIPDSVLKTRMNVTTKYKHASMSRAAVDWMVNTVDVSVFIDQFNRTGHGCDEQWLSTFQANSQLGMPGHFTHSCLEQGKNTDQVTRMTKWHTGTLEECATRTIRHSICLMGIEDLPSVASMPNLMFNKMIPSFDYSIIECTAELLHNRTFLGQMDHELDESYYGNMINVLYHKHHFQPDYTLNCTPSYQVWEYKKLAD